MTAFGECPASHERPAWVGSSYSSHQAFFLLRDARRGAAPHFGGSPLPGLALVDRGPVLPLRDDDASQYCKLVMDEQIKAAAILVRPYAANLTPERFLVSPCAGLGDDVGDVRWLIHVGLLRWFGLQQRAATLAFAENGGEQAESGFAGTQNATLSARPFSAIASVVLGGNRLQRAEGKSPHKPCRVRGYV